MGDRPIRDRTLILRVLVPGLETRLRDKMEETIAAKKEADTSGMKIGGSSNSGGGGPTNNNNNNNNNSSKEQLLDLEGVTCEPTNLQGNTLWNFHCDGAKYPARLVNLPCPIEICKTHDHAMYYKCADVAQMLIVYEDSTALAEAEDDIPKVEGFPSYYHSGITPALRRVVERRFAAREHSPVAPPRQEVSDVEDQLVDLMERISKEGGSSSSSGANNNKRTKVPSLTAAQLANKVLEEVQEEVVDYEPWMDDFGKQPHGVEFDADDPLCAHHPEVWLSPTDVKDIRLQEAEESELKRKKAASKKEKKNKKEQKKKEKELLKAEEATATTTTTTTHKKKGIASKKNTEEVDQLTQIAMAISGDVDLEVELEDDDILGFDFSGMDMMM